jgi:hypothetical protein
LPDRPAGDSAGAAELWDHAPKKEIPDLLEQTSHPERLCCKMRETS